MRHVAFFDTALRRDRVLVSAGLAAIVALSWAYMVYLAQGMGDMDTAMAMALTQSWNTVDLATLFLMWVVMMIAMMVPTAAPMILTFVTINGTRSAQGRHPIPTGAFLLGYVVVWSGFAALATGAQWGLHSAALLSPMMGSTSNVLGGLPLLAAGGYQWSPINYTCLSQCRSPMGFLMSEWREGPNGVLTMGLRLGMFCLGCAGY